MKASLLLLSFCGALSAPAIDKPVFGTREEIAAAAGEGSELVENASGALPHTEVRRFKKDGWIIVAYFGEKYSQRVIITKEDGQVLSDPEIATFLKLFPSSWGKWDIPGQRAWSNNVKAAFPRYALITKDKKALELLTDGYLFALGQQTWLRSIEPK